MNLFKKRDPAAEPLKLSTKTESTFGVSDGGDSLYVTLTHGSDLIQVNAEHGAYCRWNTRAEMTLDRDKMRKFCQDFLEADEVTP